MPEEGIGPIGAVSTRGGVVVDVLYDGSNEFVGISERDGNIIILNVSETEQIIQLLQEAINLTRMRTQSPEPPPTAF